MRRSLAAALFVMFVFGVLGASSVAAEPVVNSFKVSAKVASLTAGKSYPFTFRLFDAAQGGNKLFEEIKSYKVPTSKTIAHLLGSVSGDPTLNPLEARHFLQQVWVEVSTPSKPPFPRIMLGPVPLAIGSQDADMLDGMHASDFIGAGSSLAADSLDGYDSTAFFRLSDNVTVTGVPAFNGGSFGQLSPFTVNNAQTVVNLSADLLDGNDSSAFQKKPARVAVVAKSGGDYADPLAAMAALADWCTDPAPSASAPCLLKIMPGVYDIGSATLAMQPYVDIEGSGELSTVIAGTASTDSAAAPGVVLSGADNAELRFLTVKNLGANMTCAISNVAASPRLIFVTAVAQSQGSAYGVRNESSAGTMTNVRAGGAGAGYGFGVYNLSSAPVMHNVTAHGMANTQAIGVYNSGTLNGTQSPTMTNVAAAAVYGGATTYGIYNRDCSPTMTGVTATATGPAGVGMANSFTTGVGTPLVLADRSTFSGSTASISNVNGYTVRLSSSKLVAPANEAGTYNCVGVTKVDVTTGVYAPADAFCQ